MMVQNQGNPVVTLIPSNIKRKNEGGDQEIRPSEVRSPNWSGGIILAVSETTSAGIDDGSMMTGDGTGEEGTSGNAVIAELAGASAILDSEDARSGVLEKARDARESRSAHLGPLTLFDHDSRVRALVHVIPFILRTGNLRNWLLPNTDHCILKLKRRYCLPIVLEGSPHRRRVL